MKPLIKDDSFEVAFQHSENDEERDLWDHETRCRIRINYGGKGLIESGGLALCSKKDTFSTKFGRILSFNRAIEKIHSRETRADIRKKFHKREGIPFQASKF